MSLPGEAEEGVEDTRTEEANTGVSTERVNQGLPDNVFDCLHEQAEASDRRHVKGQRHRRESHRE